MYIHRAAALLAIAASPVFGSSVHEFCVTRVATAGNDMVRARFHFGAEDPGREAASLLLVRHYRQAGVSYVAIDAFDPERCAASEAQDIVLATRAERISDGPPAGSMPNLGRVANFASGTVTGIAEEASRLMCQLLPC